MIPNDCRRLIEVDFPITAVGYESAKEKAGPKGHPSMLQLWWARRPLAACRAVLLGLLLPDPCDPRCPDAFKRRAEALFAPNLAREPYTDKTLQTSLLRFIGEVASWGAGSSGSRLETARRLVKAAWPEGSPIVADPFAGGGSIPLEALRLGCDSFAGELNPVAVFALRTLLESIPADSGTLSKKLRNSGGEVQRELASRLSPLYSIGGGGSVPIAYLWARTIQCEAPNCGGEIPLARSFWLAKKGKEKFALKYSRGTSTSGVRRLEFEVFSPKSASEVPAGTVQRAKATCPFCGSVVPPDRVAAQLASQAGGADVIFDSNGLRTGGATLLAVVMQGPARKGRRFRVSSAEDYRAVLLAHRRLESLRMQHRGPVSLIPEEPLPPTGTLGFRVQRYGIERWGQLFSQRQLTALLTLQELVSRAGVDDPDLASVLTLAFNRVLMSGMSLTRWNPVGEKMQHTFGRQALPIVWDFAEVVPVVDAPGSWESGYTLAADVIDAWPPGGPVGHVHQADARNSPLPDSTCQVWFTDPPYYDAVPYADLSDFFYVWMKRIPEAANRLPTVIAPEKGLTPKNVEIVQDATKIAEGAPKDRAFFESSMARAFEEGRRVLRDDGVGCVVFAHKTTEGWEALLSGLIRGGWVITASWPIATEMSTRLRARESAALATSVHLICRPRSPDAAIGDWAEVARQLPIRVRSWMETLEGKGIRGADLVFSCIGPAMELYSRFSSVVDAQDREIPLVPRPPAECGA
jgi:putative DNA methylase